MRAKQYSTPVRFEVTVEFLNEDAIYGVEKYEIEATDAPDAKRLALKRSEDSPYDDDRIPNRIRRVLVTVA